MTAKTLLIILSLITGAVALGLTLEWFGWRLYLVIALFTFSQNLTVESRRL